MLLGKITKNREIPIFVHFIDGYYYFGNKEDEANPAGYYNLESMLKLKGYTRNDIIEE